MFFLFLLFTESSDEEEASGDEGLPDEDSDVSCDKLASQKDVPKASKKKTKISSEELAELVSLLIPC